MNKSTKRGSANSYLTHTKMEKGITLITLIITIIILVILAAIAINAITKDGTIKYAQNAATDYNQAIENDEKDWDEYEYILNEELNGSVSGLAAIGDATVNKKAKKISTINGKKYNENNPVIPTGFMPINTDTSNWDAENLAEEVKKGLVISDGENEFVWIPVADINDMAKTTSGTDSNSRKNYEGKLYTFTSTGASERTDYGKSTEGRETPGYREPANVTHYLHVDNASRFKTITWTENLYQESFNKMVESVAQYKGFYMGRYEMSVNATTGKAQSKLNETPAINTSESTKLWWGLYEKALTYSQSGVISEMMWGCQWDQMVIWMQGNNINVTQKAGLDVEKNKTGSTGDVLNNVYDTRGNVIEWTQIAYSTYNRQERGYNYVSYLNGDYPEYTENKYGPVGTRLTLYVEK